MSPSSSGKTTAVLQSRLKRLTVARVIVRILTIVVYTAALAWFAFCLWVPFSGMTDSQGILGFDTSSIFIIGIILFWILQFAMVRGLMWLNRSEDRIMARFICDSFPDAVYSPHSSVNSRFITDSRLFDVSATNATLPYATTYGRVDFPRGDLSVTVADIGVTSEKAAKMMYRIPIVNYFATLYRTVAKPIFGSRIDSSMHSFRGMFGHIKSRLDCKGAVILLPDHLEENIGHLAYTIQTIANKQGARLVKLEDPEFEKLFVVYADNEIEARKVLTPAMMRRLTSLRKDFGGDLTLSFSSHRIYFAAPIPGGFLRPDRQSVSNNRILDRIASELAFCHSLPDYFN